MRNRLAFAFIILLCLSDSYSQEISLGVKGGLGYATFLGPSFAGYMDLSDSDRGAFIPFGAGVFASLDFNPSFALQADILALSLGGSFLTTNFKAAFYDYYLASSLLAKASVGQYCLFAGPALLIELGRETVWGRGDSYVTIQATLEPNNAANLLFAAVSGIGWERPLGPGKLCAEARALYSFTGYYSDEYESANSAAANFMPFSLMAMLGYSLALGR